MKSQNIYLYTISITLRYINRYPVYWFWFFVRIVYVALTLAVPVLLGSIIDTLTSDIIALSLLWWFVGSYIALLLIIPILEIKTASKALEIANKVARDFRIDAIKLLEHAPIDFFKDGNRGSFLKIIDAGHYAVYHLSEDILHRYISCIASVIGIFFSSIFFEWWAIAIFIVSSILSIANLVWYSKKEKDISVDFSRTEESFTGGLAEFLNNFKTVFYLNLFKKHESDLGAKINASYEGKLTVVKWSLKKWYNNHQLEQVTTILIFVLGVLSILHGNLTIGTLIIILSFSGNLSGQLGTLLAYSESYIERVSFLERYYDTLVRPLSGKAIKKSGLLSNSFESLSLNKISVVRDERESLRNATFEISKGEKIAIVGHTGGGKSTLLDVILKAIVDYRGEVMMNSVDYRQLNGKDIAEIFSIVPQDVQLFRGTIRGNLVPEFATVSDQELYHVLDSCQIGTLVRGLPNGLDEYVSEGATNISGGERQRIGIARALLQNHPFLILDEATASLDPKTERAVIKNIIAQYPDMTLLYVTHKYALLDQFEKILVMNDGYIIEQGSFAELLADGPLFKELYTASKVS